MPTRQQLESALFNADKAGDVQAAKQLANALKQGNYDSVQPKTEEDAGFFENIGTGLASGFVGTLESAALGAATLQEEEAELKSRKKIKDIADRFTPEGGDKDSITYKLASGLGSIASFLPAAALGPVGGFAAAGALGVGAGAGEASERARAYGATEEERNVAIRKGAAIGATEVLPLGRLASNLKIPGLPEAIEKIGAKVSPATITGIKSRLQRAAATGVAEGSQEAAAAILQNLTEQGYNPEQVLLEAGVVEEGAIGGGAGAILQGLVDLLAPKKFRTVKDDGTAKETPTEETKEEPKEEPKETPVPAKPATPVETKEEPKAKPATPVETKKEPTPRVGVETKVNAFLGRLDVDKLEQRLANAEQEAKSAGLPTGTYELMVKSAINKKKETTDVGKQTTGAPDTETTGDSVPSSAGVVGVERTESAEESGRPVEGGLADSVSDTGRPARRARKSNATVKPKVKPKSKLSGSAKVKQLRNLRLKVDELQALETDAQPDTIVAEEDVREPSISDVPTYDAKTKKLSFKASKKLVGTHEAYKDDIARLDNLVSEGAAKDTSRQPEDIKTLEAIPEKKRTKTQKNKLVLLTKQFELNKKSLQADAKVIRYLNNFKTPMDGLYAAIYEVSDPDSTAVYKPTEGAKVKDPLQTYTVGTGGANAQAVVDWMQANLSKETNRQLRQVRRKFKKESAAFEKAIEAQKTTPKKAGDAQKKASAQVRRMIDRQRAAGPVTIIKGGKRTEVEAGKVKDIDETKLSTEDKAKLDAYNNFAKLVKNPKTD